MPVYLEVVRARERESCCEGWLKKVRRCQPLARYAPWWNDLRAAVRGSLRTSSLSRANLESNYSNRIMKTRLSFARARYDANDAENIERAHV